MASTPIGFSRLARCFATGRHDGVYKLSASDWLQAPRLIITGDKWNLSFPNPIGGSDGKIRCEGEVCTMIDTVGKEVGEVNFEDMEAHLKESGVGDAKTFSMKKRADRFSTR